LGGIRDKPFQHSALYWAIELALAAQVKRFASLSSEMDSFSPRPRDEIEQEHEIELKRFFTYNPHQTEEQIRTFFAKQLEMKLDTGIQLVNRFGNQFTAEVVGSIILAASLAEAVINAVLALGLSLCDNAELFELVDSAELKKKWLVGPRLFVPDYRLPKNGHLFETLTLMCKVRNDLVHAKITIEDGSETVVLEGSKNLRFRMDAVGRTRIMRILTLPYDLHEHLVKQVKDAEIRFRIEHILNRNYIKA
jgi:hypothetical protein